MFKVTAQINNTRQTIGEYSIKASALMAKSKALNAGYSDIEAVKL